MLQCGGCFHTNKLENPFGRTTITERGITRAPNGAVLKVRCEKCLKKEATK